MKVIISFFTLLISALSFSQSNIVIDSTKNFTPPSLASLSLNGLTSNVFKADFSNIKVNTHYREIKEVFFVLSKNAFQNYDQFDYDVFKYTPGDALRKISPNYDLHIAPLPSPTYYPVD